jgi:3-oxoadipate enol-lactonase
VEEGAGRPVVLIHGGLGDLRMWDDVVPLLAERYRVVRFDLPGFGKRPGAPFAPGELLANLLDELGIDRAPLVGLSLGGRVALDAALQRPDRVSALVLVAPGVTGLSPAGIYSDEQNREFDEALASGDVERAAEIDLSVWAPLGADERIRELLRDNISGGGDVEVRWTDPPAAERLGDVRVPTLVVVGTRDVPRMLEIADLLVSRIPDARRAELESDHYLPLREPERFAALVAGFLG